jgi:hypothetical protein
MGNLYRDRQLFIPHWHEKTYYVDATGGSDSNDGVSPSSPWQTIAKVNAASFNPGARILFKRGETWNSEELNPPTSGSSGSYITFGAYGSGVAPIIDAQVTGNYAIEVQESYIIVEYLHLKNTAAHGVVFAGAQNCIMHNCEVSSSGSANIVVWDAGDLTSQNITIRNCAVHDAAMEGIYITNNTAGNLVSNVLVENCTVYDNPDENFQIAFNAPGTAAPTGVIIRRNTVYGGGGDNGAMQVWGPTLIERNDISDWTAGAAIQSDKSDGAIFRNNVIHDASANSGDPLAGIRVNGDTTNVDIFHNTIYGITNAGAADGVGFYGNNGDGTVTNNCISGCDDQMFWFPADAPTANKNCVYGTTSETGTNAVTDDPLLVNPGADDFHLQSDSPCRGVGATGLGVTEDYDGVTRGSPPDIGAYEYVS